MPGGHIFMYQVHGHMLTYVLFGLYAAIRGICRLEHLDALHMSLGDMYIKLALST